MSVLSHLKEEKLNLSLRQKEIEKMIEDEKQRLTKNYFIVTRKDQPQTIMSKEDLVHLIKEGDFEGTISKSFTEQEIEDLDVKIQTIVSTPIIKCCKCKRENVRLWRRLSASYTVAILLSINNQRCEGRPVREFIHRLKCTNCINDPCRKNYQYNERVMLKNKYMPAIFVFNKIDVVIDRNFLTLENMKEWLRQPE